MGFQPRHPAAGFVQCLHDWNFFILVQEKYLEYVCRHLPIVYVSDPGSFCDCRSIQDNEYVQEIPGTDENPKLLLSFSATYYSPAGLIVYNQIQKIKNEKNYFCDI